MPTRALYPFTGYRLYVVLHKKEGRRMACLVKPGGRERTTLSYARYRMSIKLRRFLLPTEHVDHKNDDKLDDRLDNYQILTPEQNRAKSARRKTYIEKVCPICDLVFLLEKRQDHKTAEPCCSRKCGGIKSRLVAGREA